MPQTVLVILSTATPPPGLARAAVRNGWPIHNAPVSHTQLIASLDRGHSAVAIVHIPLAEEPALSIIRALRASGRCAILIAVSAAATDDAEVHARAAGASLFLPAAASAELIERTVLALHAPAQRTAPAHEPLARPSAAV